MALRAIVTGLVAAGAVALAAPAGAADLSYGEKRAYGSNLDDYSGTDTYTQQRWRRDDRRWRSSYQDDERYGRDDDARGYSLKDTPRTRDYGYRDEDDYDDDLAAKDYDDDTLGSAYNHDRHRCIPRGRIRHRLIKHGWQHVRLYAEEPQCISFEATRSNGLNYRLNIDPCSGVILSARLLNPPFASKRRRADRTAPLY